MEIIDLNAFKTKIVTNFRLYLLLFLGGSCLYSAILMANYLSRLYLILLLPGIAFLLFAYFESKHLEKKKLLVRLREEWGIEELAKERNFEEINTLFELSSEATGAIDDRTWHDLNMDFVFSRIDRTFSWAGCQHLYRILRTPEIQNIEKIKKRDSMSKVFEADLALREEVQLILAELESQIGAGLSILLWGKPQVSLTYPLWVYQIMFILALFSPLLILVSLRYILATLLIFQVNMYLHFKTQKEIKAYFEGIRSLRQLMHISGRLISVKSDSLEMQLSKIRGPFLKTRQFTKLVRFVGVETTDPFLHIFQQYFTIFLLAEVRGLYKALDFIENNREDLQSLFTAIGEIDVLQSMASYRASLNYFCVPQFEKNRGLQLEDAYHPLLKEAVSNSVVAQERGILITGSNMSGKSTFLRAVGLNVLLAQTIATCTAKSYRACPMLLLTSIGRSDNVVEGKSYYLDEALGILRILETINNDATSLVIFDELYRGTNSEERIFAARRVLEYLVDRNALVFVATHDLELTSLLEESYSNWHFSERVSDLGLEFDYKLKRGSATTKNAIALLRYLGYPTEITRRD